MKELTSESTLASHWTKKLLNELFEEQVEKKPNNIAVSFQGEQLTYRELNQRSNRLAHFLRNHPLFTTDETSNDEYLIALYLDKSLDTLVSILAVLKAGCAYVPISEQYPKLRAQFILNDTKPALILTQRHHIKKLSAWVEELADKPDLIKIDSTAEFDCLPSHNLDVTWGHDRLAYVIYTSGTTGTPKGVMVEQGTFIKYLWNFRCKLYQGCQWKRFNTLSISNYVFDIFGLDFGIPLISGDSVILSSLTNVTHQEISNSNIVQQTPLVMFQLSSLFPKAFTDKLCLVGGEPLAHYIADELKRNFHHVFNVYGPTETTIWCTSYQLDRGEESVLIGRPIDGAVVYVLDENRREVPIGTVGELYIGGEFVSRGYLNRPELTQERFINNSFATLKDEERGHVRLYQTGDLVRSLPCGNLAFIGRNDTQVKISGNRVELGEVQTAISKLFGVKQVVVIDYEYEQEKYLAAYIVPEKGKTLDVNFIREELIKTLPIYMVPKSYSLISQLPLTVNGKLDRASLPKPVTNTKMDNQLHQSDAAQSSINAQLIDIWMQLGLMTANEHTNFFQLGGNSLLAAKMVIELRARDFVVDVKAIYENPEIKQLADYLQKQPSSAQRVNNDRPTNDNRAQPAYGVASLVKQTNVDNIPWLNLSRIDIEQVVASVVGGWENIQAICPLGVLQQGLFYHHLLNSTGDFYVLWRVLRFSDRSILDCYIDAINTAIKRHEALRTSIYHRGISQPVQVVWKHAALRAEQVFLDAHVDDIAKQLYNRFNPEQCRIALEHAPLQRCFFSYDEKNDDWVLLHLTHHITLDHVSLELLEVELEQEMLARQTEQKICLSKPISFRYFLKRNLNKKKPEKDSAYFLELLQGYEPHGTLLGQRISSQENFKITETIRLFDSKIIKKLRSLVKNKGVNSAATFHLAWAKVLACLCGSDDIAFATVLSGRMQAEAGEDRAFGLFINTLPIRLNLTSTYLREALLQTQQILIELMVREHVSLADVQKIVEGAANTPVLNSLFNYRRSEAENGITLDALETYPSANVEGMKLSRVNDRTNYPVTVSVIEYDTQFLCHFQVEQSYDPDRFFAYLQQALAGIVDALEQTVDIPLSVINILPPSERNTLLNKWNDTEKAFPVESCLHTLIEKRVDASPDNIAVCFSHQTLTYHALNEQANQLAHYLIDECGIRPDIGVAVCMERSIDMVVVLLAILKSGGAYLPLDPQHPPERITYMLQDAGVCVLLTHDKVDSTVHGEVQSFCTERRSRVINITEHGERWKNKCTANPDPCAQGLLATHLAYIIYTSGSTGQPKGVMNEHQAVVNRISWMQDRYPLNSSDCVAQKTPCGFDVSVWEFFWPLIAGARLEIAEPGGHKDPHYLEHWLREKQVTTTHFVPSMLSAFLDQFSSTQDQSLKRVFCSGETLPSYIVKRFKSLFPEVELHNLYGPTEAAIDVTAWDCRVNDIQDTVPIGKPISNIKLYILDTHGMLCPSGVIGELHIAGVGVARGYVNKPDQTAEKFVHNPFSCSPYDRMYRTGDLTRYLPEGDIEFIGRNDFQVKVRGVRIELGEIECVLAAHSTIRNAVVIPWESATGGSRLVAYVCLESESFSGTKSELIAQLREYLTSLLPEVMVPGVIVPIKKLPLTGNGKLDRRALPKPSDICAIDAIQLIKPCEGIEDTLATVWSELLEIPKAHVGRNSSFYQLGGHSLLAVNLVARIAQTFNVSVSLADIMSQLTLQAQASLIEQIRTNNIATAALKNETEKVVPTLNFKALPMQKSIYKAIKLNPTGLENNSFIALRFENNTAPRPKQLRNVLQDTFSKHQNLRAIFHLNGEQLYLQIPDRFSFRLEKRQTLGSLEQDLRDFLRPFTLEDGMNVRGRWVIGECESVLLLDFSHACVDGFAISQLLADMAGTNNDAVNIHTPSFEHYSTLYYSELFEASHRQHLDYWIETLRSWTPTEAAGRELQPLSETARITLPLSVKNSIEAIIVSLNISFSEFFFAAFLVLHRRLDLSPSQLTSTAFHGRDRHEQQGLVAPLMSVLPIRIDHVPKHLTNDFLLRVSQQVREAYKHYLFDAETILEERSDIHPQAVYPASFFGFVIKEEKTGRMSDSDYTHLELPSVVPDGSHWRMTFEVIEHKAGFELHLDAVDYFCVMSEINCRKDILEVVNSFIEEK